MVLRWVVEDFTVFLVGVGKVTTWHLLNIYTDYVVGFVNYLTGHGMRHEHRIST